LNDILARALGHHQAGRLIEAEALYRELLAGQPDHPDALHYLGVLALQGGDGDGGGRGRPAPVTADAGQGGGGTDHPPVDESDIPF